MSKLRLGPLPKTELVKVTIALPVRLKNDLERYAELHSETHGEIVDASIIIPHMLESFVARDRAFQKIRRKTTVSE
jgi:hypothetical protein